MFDRVSSCTSANRDGLVVDQMYTMLVSGSKQPPSQFAPPVAAGSIRVPALPPSPATIGGVKIGPILWRLRMRNPSALISGVQSSTSASETPCRSNAAGLVGNGCVGEYHSPGTLPFGTGRSSIGQTGSPVMRSNVYSQPCFDGSATALIARPFTVISI